MGQLRGTIIPVAPFQQTAVLWDDDSKQAVVVDPGGALVALRAQRID